MLIAENEAAGESALHGTRVKSDFRKEFGIDADKWNALISDPLLEEICRYVARVADNEDHKMVASQIPGASESSGNVSEILS